MEVIEAKVWLSLCLSLTVLICLAMTVILIYFYNSNEPIEEMSDKERFMKRKVDKSKPILEENVLESDYLEIESFHSDEDLTKLIK